MENIEYTVSEDGIMTIKIDTNYEGGPSASGKTIRIASSRGNKSLDLPNGQKIYMGINLYKYPER